MHGLEAVASVGKGAPDNDRHGVVEIGAAHLLFDIDGDEICAAVRRWSIERELGILIVCHRFSTGLQEGGKKGPEEAGPGPQVAVFILVAGKRF